MVLGSVVKIGTFPLCRGSASACTFVSVRLVRVGDGKTQPKHILDGGPVAAIVKHSLSILLQNVLWDRDASQKRMQVVS